MKKVLSFCVDHQMVTQEPSIGYGEAAPGSASQLRFDPSYIRLVAAKK